MSEEKYLIVKGIAGLGNRMLSALTGILYTRLTGRRLIIDWSDHYYSSDGSNVFHRYFECPLTNPTDEIPATDSVSPPIWRGNLHESAWYMRKQEGQVYNPEAWQIFSIDLERLDHDEDVIVMWTYDEKVDLLRKHFKETFAELNGISTDNMLRKLLGSIYCSVRKSANGSTGLRKIISARQWSAYMFDIPTTGPIFGQY